MNEYNGWQIDFDRDGYFASKNGKVLVRGDHLWQIRDQIDVWDGRLIGNIQ